MKRVVTAAIVVIAGLLLWARIRTPPPPSVPRAIWDPSPDALIVQVAPFNLEMYPDALPYVRLWGDGRIIWTTTLPGRKVYEGHLSPEVVRSVIQRLIDAGLANTYPGSSWWLPYPTVEPAANMSVSAYLDGASGGVTRNQYNFTMEQREVIAFLRSGAGAQRTLFIPSTGRLRVFKYEETSSPPIPVQTSWPDEQFGYRLADVPDQGRQISGDELAWVWDLMNETSFPLVESDGEAYWTYVEIPGISLSSE